MPDALESLKTAKKVVGCKQTRRAIQEGRASVLFLADDADPMLTAPLALEATMQGIEIGPRADDDRPWQTLRHLRLRRLRRHRAIKRFMPRIECSIRVMIHAEKAIF